MNDVGSKDAVGHNALHNMNPRTKLKPKMMMIQSNVLDKWRVIHYKTMTWITNSKLKRSQMNISNACWERLSLIITLERLT